MFSDLRVSRPVGASSRYAIGYPSQQIMDELLRTGKATDKGKGVTRYCLKSYKSVERRFKANAIEPTGNFTFAHILCYTRTPWGTPQSVTKLPAEAEGLYFVSTAGHGGLWLSDKWIKRLPKTYRPFTGNRRWAEEDCDSAEVLQYFGLLSLVSEPTELEITQDDIEKGKSTRKDWRDRPMSDPDFDDGHVGGALEEAWKRKTGYQGHMISTQRCFQAAPGIWKYCRMSEDGAAFIKAFDAGEQVEPTTILLEPYVFTNFNNPR